ncbi:S1C family serine protease [Papillibacter cinnamivorans]|uniref:Trypsin-like peptidase domain-containing protein n=1 Tax=Papillibacter cinnamivorans DSM 12816 TaxID=1122930 RepID=A0A1W2C1J5_9FIRM|nr:trypsin-like peptidase domain-containing protein [Papillibacter cinnamivorans]SMC78956.1 Trypsin-like peptidase domain-containing protein [Papillibacter cinnamivorans DSM 12816]
MPPCRPAAVLAAEWAEYGGKGGLALKKWVVSLLCFAILVSLAPVPVSAASAADRDVSYEQTLAQDLKNLGLFRGVSDTDFDLDRAPSRAEALVMLIRMLGLEDDAMSGAWAHPFTDVDAWADRYVGYAYNRGLTNGVSGTSFGTGSASAAMYLTFVLRALGYSDVNGEDFTWDNPYGFAQVAGILPDRVDLGEFWRADVVLISYAALSAKLKNSDVTLGEKLIAAGSFTQVEFEAYYDPDALTARDVSGKDVLSSKEIYAMCSPAVFCIETFDVNGNPYGQGSGFFIDPSGVAVTNYHVVDNIISAYITLDDGSVYNVTGVILFDEEIDFAVIQVYGSGFDTLKVGNSALIEGGETVYAIGNPEGLTNTISQGLVSNPKREDFDGMMQISAPISPGSSGGALINEYGEVIGITTSGYYTGQNLNFAVPINDVISDKQYFSYADRYGVFSLPEFAAYRTYLDAMALPGFLDSNVEEAEYNDSQVYADNLENGDSAWGVIDGDDMDVFRVYCNMEGTIDIALLSPYSSNAYVEDLILLVAPEEASDDSDYIFAEYVETSGGRGVQELTYEIPRPGVYYIYVLSSEYYKYVDLHTDYVFYYTFTPVERIFVKQ